MKDGKDYKESIIKSEINMLAKLFEITRKQMDPEEFKMREFRKKFFGKYDPGITDNPDIFQAAFTNEMMNDMNEEDR